MAPSSVKRSLLAFLVAVIVAITCMLVLAMQVPSVAAVHAPSSDFKRFGIGEVVDEDDDDDDDDDDWDFMDDDAILSLSQQLNAGARGDTKHISESCVDSLPVELVDDDYCDCEDGSDEPNTAACSHVLLGSFRPPFGRQFSCKADDKLVSLAAVDDGVCDCCDGSDEREGLCVETCEQQWQQRLERLRGRLEMLQRGQRTRKEYLARAVDKVKTLNEDFERLEESYQAGQRAFEELQGRVQHNPELQGHLEQSYSVLRRVQYVAYVQSRVVDPGTFTDAAWKPAFSELVGKCFSYTVDEKELKGGTPNVIPRQYEMVFCPFQNVSQTEPSYPKWTKAERQTKVGVSAADENEEEEEVPRPIRLGVWYEWLDSAGFARVQDYNHGEPCASGQERQTRVELSCGDTNRVVAVEEREMCEYEIRFETPAACETKEEEALLDEIARVQRFPKQQEQDGGKAGGKFEGHEEL